MRAGLMIQRADLDSPDHGADGDRSALADRDTAGDRERPASSEGAGWIVDDEVETPGPGQIRRSEFLARLRAAVVEQAEEVFQGTAYSTSDCPWIDYWFGYYGRKDARHIEAGIHRYVQGLSGAASAADYIPAVAGRVRRGVLVWVMTGRVVGVPDAPPEDAAPGAAPSGGAVQAKELDGSTADPLDPVAARSELGAGRRLDGAVASRMGSVFGHDFSEVRIHTDTRAARLSGRMRARAFTVGNHVAFGGNEFRPGSPVGDGLIAHELAHVVQQRNGSGTGSGGGYGALESDADRATAGVMSRLWGLPGGGAGRGATAAGPALRGGLTLQRCKDEPHVGDGLVGTNVKPPEKSVPGALDLKGGLAVTEQIPGSPKASDVITDQEKKKDVALVDVLKDGFELKTSVIPNFSYQGNAVSLGDMKALRAAGVTRLTIEGFEENDKGKGNGDAVFWSNDGHEIQLDDDPAPYLKGTAYTEPGNVGNLKLVSWKGDERVATTGFSVQDAGMLKSGSTMPGYAWKLGAPFSEYKKSYESVHPGQTVDADTQQNTFNEQIWDAVGRHFDGEYASRRAYIAMVVKRQMARESSFAPTAFSSKSATGVMQIINKPGYAGYEMVRVRLKEFRDQAEKELRAYLAARGVPQTSIDLVINEGWSKPSREKIRTMLKDNKKVPENLIDEDMVTAVETFGDKQAEYNYNDPEVVGKIAGNLRFGNDKSLSSATKQEKQTMVDVPDAVNNLSIEWGVYYLKRMLLEVARQDAEQGWTTTLKEQLKFALAMYNGGSTRTIYDARKTSANPADFETSVQGGKISAESTNYARDIMGFSGDTITIAEFLSTNPT